MGKPPGPIACLPARGPGSGQGQSGRRRHGSPGFGPRVEVLVLERLRVGPELRQPLFVIQQPQRASQRVRRALARPRDLAKDALVVLGRPEAD